MPDQDSDERRSRERRDDPAVLAAAAARGDRDAFERLVVVTQADLRLYIAAIAEDQIMVDEVLQSTYVVAYRRRSDFQDGRDPAPWLRGIARNLTRKAAIARGRRRRRHQDLLETAADDDPAEVLAQDDERAWTRARLHDCLQQLDDDERRLLAFRYRDGQTIAAIATRITASAPSLSRHLRRLLQKLRSCMLGRGNRQKGAVDDG